MSKIDLLVHRLSLKVIMMHFAFASYEYSRTDRYNSLHEKQTA